MVYFCKVFFIAFERSAYSEFVEQSVLYVSIKVTATAGNELAIIPTSFQYRTGNK